jgi:molecular chaperone GrpE
VTTESDNTPVDTDKAPAPPASEAPQSQPTAHTSAPAEAPGAGEHEDEGRLEAAEAESSELDQLRAERDKLKDQLLRTAADFDNFRKRTRRELDEAKMRGKDDAVRDLLPVFDNLERAVAAGETAQDVSSVVEGVRMVLKLFQDTAERMGLNRVVSVGARFDPNMHEAIQQEETAEHAPGTIVREVMPGYLFGKRLIRAAMVVVARAPAPQAVPEPALDAEASGEAAPAGSSSRAPRRSSRPAKARSKAPPSEESVDDEADQGSSGEAKPE